MKNIFLCLMFLIGSSAIAETLKKISIVSTNNGPFFMTSGSGVYAESSLQYLTELKNYVVKHGYNVDEKLDDVEFAVATLKWVSAQWDHDGMNQPPAKATALDVLKSVYDKKEKYRCVEYGLVLSDVLQAYGFITRKIALRSKDVAYGGMGRGHVATEVWINSLGKWIFLDGQFGAYWTKPESKIPLSYYEIFEQRKLNKWNDLEIHFATPQAKLSAAMSDYRSFLNSYFGHITVSAGPDTPRVSLLMEASDFPITFQGLPSDDLIFTRDASQLYPEMNRVSVILKYKAQPSDFRSVIGKLNIQNDEDYVRNLPKFSAVPDYEVNLKTTEPFFDHYEFRTDKSGSWKRATGTKFDWLATGKTNHVEARAVNKMGRAGPPTFIDLTYQE